MGHLRPGVRDSRGTGNSVGYLGLKVSGRSKMELYRFGTA